jgi:hypothetical protein
MLRTPLSLNVHATVDPIGDAMRFSGDGKLRTWFTVKVVDSWIAFIPTGHINIATKSTTVWERRLDVHHTDDTNAETPINAFCENFTITAAFLVENKHWFVSHWYSER